MLTAWTYALRAFSISPLAKVASNFFIAVFIRDLLDLLRSVFALAISILFLADFILAKISPPKLSENQRYYIIMSKPKNQEQLVVYLQCFKAYYSFALLIYYTININYELEGCLQDCLLKWYVI